MKTMRPVLISLIVFYNTDGNNLSLAVTGNCSAVFPAQANGSIILKDGKPVGSALIGQPFDHPKYFWGRLSGPRVSL